MLHKDSTAAIGNHYIQAWEVADAAAKTALAGGLVAADVGKVCRQLDTNTFTVLTNHVGPVWVGITTPANTDGLTEGAANLYFTAARVRATVLTGLSTAAGTVVTAAHTILEAIGFLQKQASDNTASISTINTTLTNKLKQFIPVACGDETTAITTGTAKVAFRMPFAMTLSAIKASLTTAQTSGAIFTVNVKKNGSTVFSTKITLDNTEKTTATAATAPVLSVTSLADDDEITIDVDQVGDGTAKGLKVYLVGTVT